MTDTAEHFEGCHPEHTHDARETPEGFQPQESEQCWHCGTPTTRGCNCADCWDSADDVPPDVVYHCPTCRRWWAYMWPVIHTLTFPGTG